MLANCRIKRIEKEKNNITSLQDMNGCSNVIKINIHFKMFYLFLTNVIKMNNYF